MLRGADAGLIPYAINDLTRSVFPMKVYEYLSAGLPVVSTPLPALAGVAAITVVADAADGRARDRASCSPPTAPETRRARSDAAQAHSWDRAAPGDRPRRR